MDKIDLTEKFNACCNKSFMQEAIEKCDIDVETVRQDPSLMADFVILTSAIENNNETLFNVYSDAAEKMSNLNEIDGKNFFLEAKKIFEEKKIGKEAVREIEQKNVLSINDKIEEFKRTKDAAEYNGDSFDKDKLENDKNYLVDDEDLESMEKDADHGDYDDFDDFDDFGDLK